MAQTRTKAQNMLVVCVSNMVCIRIFRFRRWLD